MPLTQLATEGVNTRVASSRNLASTTKTAPVWEDITPIIPSNKVPITESAPRNKRARAKKAMETGGTTSILLMRVGEERQGVLGLHLAGVGDEKFQSLSIRFMGIDNQGVARYLLTCYFSVTVLVPDALGVLESVKV